MNRKEREDLLCRSERQVDLLQETVLSKTGLIERARLGFAGSHTVVTYPPLDALEVIEADLLLDRISPVKDLNIYLHIAFCEFLCPFCHYDTQYTKIGGQESEGARNYLDALKSEIQNWKTLVSDSTLNSIYIGGGTPTVVSADRLLELMSLLDDLKRSKNFTACVETSPLTATASDGRKKLATLARAGVNRFSIGIQSFNEQLLKRSRGHGQKVVLDALRVVLGLTDNVNIDLIQDLPNQSIDHVLDDLDFVEMLRPSQVTWYIMRLRPESAWFKTYTRSRLDLGDSLSSVQKRVLILDGMTRLGYKPHPGGRFIRDDHFKDDYKTVRAGLDSTLLGLGVSAYSHGWDYLFRNVFSTVDLNGAGEYIRRVRKFGFAIESGYLIDEVENIASRLVSGIRSGARLPDPTPSTEFYLNESRSVLNSLCSFGLIDVDSEGSYSLSETGFLFEEEICSMFYSPAVRERLRTKYSNGAATA